MVRIRLEVSAFVDAKPDQAHVFARFPSEGAIGGSLSLKGAQARGARIIDPAEDS
jgi:hypothetical protein